MEHLVKLLLLFFTSCTTANEVLIINPRSCKNGRLDRFNNCICDDGYKGDFCETAVCIVSCMNGGFCIIPNGDWCYCIEGYMGIFCETTVCKPVCMNGGTCTAPNQCSCIEGYKGHSCETPVCKPVCMNGGTCTTPNQCSCIEGYKGRACETPVCKPVCMNGGTCTAPNQCSCIEGYNGRTCETPVCKPVCINGGTCTSPNQCSCIEEYKGRSCETPVCKPVCMNGGTCTSPNQCNCIEGYKRRSCETPVCKPVCMNGGTCIAPNRCICPDGYKGASCETTAILDGTYDESYYDSDEYYEYTFLFLSIMGSILGALIVRFCCCCICKTIQSYRKKNGSGEGENNKEAHEVNTLSYIEVKEVASAFSCKKNRKASLSYTNPLFTEVNQAASTPVEEPSAVVKDIVLPQTKKSAGERLSSYSEIYNLQPLEPQMCNSQPSAPMYVPGSYGEHPPSYLETLAQDINQGPLPYCIQPFVPQMYGSPIYSPGLHGGFLQSYSEILAQDVHQGQLSKEEELEIVKL